LQKEVKKNGPFTEVGVKQFLSEILPVVQYIHSNQIIHRDIKPANLIRREQDKQLVMIDFGAVKDKVNPPKIDASDQTALTAYAIGTPGYAPPEQMAMRPVYASDLYAIGVTCVYLLTGKSPKDLPYDPQSGELRWQERVMVSSHFSKVLSKMLDISVHNRYQMASDVIRDLEMEPYLESLAQNMSITKPEAAVKTAADQNREALEKRVSPSSRMAAAIRARKERRTKSDESYSGVERRRPKKQTPQSLQEAYEKGYRDFSDQILTQLDLHKQVLVGARFAKATLRKTNLNGADLSNTHFGQANLSQA
ncbi:MAG: pentapeptide repeat-containing protein, partial [Cyanobacteria bacterium J06649_4]